MPGNIAVSTEMRGGLDLRLEQLHGVHAPHLDQQRIARLAGWAAASLKDTIASPDGPLEVTCRWQHAGGAVRDVEVSVKSAIAPAGYVRALVVPLMGLGRTDAGQPLARVRFVVEADFAKLASPNTIVHSYLIDGAGGNQRTE